MAITKIQSESLNLADTYAFTGTVTGAGGVNTPAFAAKISSTQTISNNTETKLACATEVFDTDGDYDHSTNYRFTPTTAGKYFIYGYVYLLGISGERFLVGLYKSGTKFVESGSMASSANNYPQLVCGYADLSDTDYIELYFNSPVGSSNAYSSGITVQWGGYKIIE